MTAAVDHPDAFAAALGAGRYGNQTAATPARLRVRNLGRYLALFDAGDGPPPLAFAGVTLDEPLLTGTCLGASLQPTGSYASLDALIRRRLERREAGAPEMAWRVPRFGFDLNDPEPHLLLLTRPTVEELLEGKPVTVTDSGLVLDETLTAAGLCAAFWG